MPTYFFVAPAAVEGRTASSPPCASLDDALRGASFMLSNGASSVWIVDNEGNLVVPPEQVHLRLKRSDPSAGAPTVFVRAVTTKRSMPQRYGSGSLRFARNGES